MRIFFKKAERILIKCYYFTYLNDNGEYKKRNIIIIFINSQ